MLRITVELWPGGLETGKSKIAQMDIANIGVGTKGGQYRNYKGRLYRRGKWGTVQKTAVLENYPRESYTVWVLVMRMLKELLK